MTTLVLVGVVELEVQDLTLHLLDSSVTQRALVDKGFNLQLLEGQLFMLQVELVLHTIWAKEQTVSEEEQLVV
jgi:hypothetical protein